MDLSVLIPTHARPERIAECVRALGDQTLDPSRFEVIVGVDGEPHAETSIVPEAADGRIDARVCNFDQAGPAMTRNLLLGQARAPIVLFLNDDVVPDRDLLRVHAETHDRLTDEGRQAMVLGAAPWKVRQPDRLFDRLVRETSMVFFYDQMTPPRADDPDHDWGFRHAWTLNLSLPRDAMLDVGGFDHRLPAACFEDIELAYRLAQAHSMPVLYRPSAIVTHDHRYQPLRYLARERTLGYESVRLARLNPSCACAIFGQDITDPANIDYARSYVEHEHARVGQLEETFLALADMPADCVTGPHEDHILRMLYQQHLPLKRFHWRLGLLDATDANEDQFRLAG